MFYRVPTGDATLSEYGATLENAVADGCDASSIQDNELGLDLHDNVVPSPILMAPPLTVPKSQTKSNNSQKQITADFFNVIYNI